MTNRNRYKKWCLILLIILTGSFSFAEGKKTLPANTTNSECTECNEGSLKNTIPDCPPPAPGFTQEKQVNSPQSLTPPSSMMPEDKGESG
jgi:hypothetical protein